MTYLDEGAKKIKQKFSKLSSSCAESSYHLAAITAGTAQGVLDHGELNECGHLTQKILRVLEIKLSQMFVQTIKQNSVPGFWI
uniref:Uncharacterized protein n=1 Tax=Romanomermis culicivorax TaxID=13658 RepID=A0A915HPN0_ROMCU